MFKGTVKEKNILPVKILESVNVRNADRLLEDAPACVSLGGRIAEKAAVFCGKGAGILLDFGRETAGGIRIITHSAKKGSRLHIRFGESASEAKARRGYKNAGNDHSPRDIRVCISPFSDLTFGQTAFRFVFIESLSEEDVTVQNIWAASRLPEFPYEGYIKTDDDELNRILDTAAYTIRMNCQNGYIWDGVKRDRLVWSGDMHQEIVTAAYLFGNIENIPASISFLRTDTKPGAWINHIPSYSAWWVINLCAYCRLSGNTEYFNDNLDYAREILKKFNSCISENGKMNLGDGGMSYFLDWPTLGSPDAETGTAALLVFAAKYFAEFEENGDCADICRKLAGYLERPCEAKQVRAFQILAGGSTENAAEQLEKNGASGFSTFMSYYILSADGAAGGRNMLKLIKDYFGAMLSRGATTFWEDFDLAWLDGSGRIDELPKKGLRDIHGDYGKYCYKGFRHSLCHGWSAGVYAFFTEYVLGIKLENGRVASVTPHPVGLGRIEAEIPTADGMLRITVLNGKAEYAVTEY